MVRHAFIAVAALASIAAAPVSKAKELRWFSGSWVSETADGWTEELWTAPRGGMLLGVNRSGKGATASGFEYMRIAEAEDGRVTFWASPGGAPPVAFVRTAAGRQRAVFENPKNDYPQRIVYERRGDVLTGTISDIKGGKPMRWTFRRVR